jgi:hypothetical protein
MGNMDDAAVALCPNSIVGDAPFNIVTMLNGASQVKFNQGTTVGQHSIKKRHQHHGPTLLCY